MGRGVIMSITMAEIPTNNPEKGEALDDNARKFITEPLDAQLFDDKQVTSYTLVVDWLETNKASEKKLAHKTFEDGTVQILLITKLTRGGNRKTVKEPLTEERYHQLAAGSLLHLEKTRHEFSYVQDGVTFSMKYDMFAGGTLHMLEVDAPGDDERVAFSPSQFPGGLGEVTGNLEYYGYRICAVL